MEKVVVEKGIQENSVSRMKRFEDLTFTDDFMFCTTLKENPDLCKEMAEMIIGRKISEIVSVQKQWSVEILPNGRGVRFDVCLEGEEEICDIEMQNNVNRNVLPKRMRYYQGAMDIDELKRSEDYTKLKKSYILFICREMPFEGKDLHKFTFRNVCVEDPELELGDETCKIFLTPAGTADDISKEMRELMSYIADNKAESDFTVRLENAVNAIKKGEGWRREYAQLKEKMDAQYEAGKNEGIAEGWKSGIAEGRKSGIAEGIETGIKALIQDNLEEKVPTERIVEKLKKRFSLSEKEANEKIKMYGN